MTPTLEEFEGFLGVSLKGKTPYTKVGQVPEVEELSISLQIPISNTMVNWKKKEDFSGFRKAYLEYEAEKLFGARHWDALGNILALLIYGLMLFSTFEGFIDSTTISIFWDI